MASNAPVYMVDFAVFNPSPDMRVDWNFHREHSTTIWQKYGVSEKMISFCDKVFNGSGIAQDVAALPPWLLPHLSDKPYTDLDHSAREARMVQGSTISELLRKTGIDPSEIDILVTNCSIYCPVPSMASLLINMFGMREDVQAYHLGGMGCSMGVVGLNLVRDLLKAHPNKIALFVSNEVVTAGFYIGERREALITNTLFRMGGSACIMTNRPSYRLRSKYSLFHVNRVHTGKFPRAFGCLNLEPDEHGVNGLLITKDLPSEAALALNKAIGQVAPLIMPWSQYAEAALHYAQDFANAAMGRKRLPAYQPDFTKCADKFLMHAGGYAILQAVKNGLKLPADKMMPSFVSLRDYGNTSSSSTWYTWGYIEACEGIKAGETIMQIGVGGGMKAGVAIWRALRTFKDNHPAWAHLNGRVQTEADLPRPITVAYKSVYDSKAALEAQQKLKAEKAAAAAAQPGADKERVKIEFDASKVNRNLKIRSWKDIPADDMSAWWRAPPGNALDDEPPTLATRGWLGNFRLDITKPQAAPAEAVKPSAAADAGKLKLVVMAP